MLQFISDNGGDKIATILMSHKLTGQLKDSERRALLHVVIDFVIQKYGYYPTKDIKIGIANAAASLFPCLGKKQGNNVFVSNELAKRIYRFRS